MTTEIQTYTEPAGGWASDGTEELPRQFPMISLIPPIAATKELLAGEFKHSDREKSEPIVEGVIIYTRETRALFEKDGTDPVCRSDDGKVPAVGMPVWEQERVVLKDGAVTVPDRPANCARCPFSQWNDKSAPPCGNSYLLLVDRGDGDLAQLRVKGTSIKPYKDWIANKPHGKPTYFFKATISSEGPISRGNNKWYEMRFKAEPLPEEDVLRYHALILEQRAHFQEVAHVEEQETTAFMAEVAELMQAYLLRAADVSKFINAPFNEDNLQAILELGEYKGLEALFAAVQRETTV